MRNLNEISGVAIMLFLVIGINYYEGNLQRLFLASGALFIGIYMVIIKLRGLRGKKGKRRGFLKG